MVGSRRLLISLCLLAAGLRLGLIVWRWDGTTTNFESGDYTLYRIGGQHILAHHNFSNSLFLVRPPLFPLMVAAIGVNDLMVLIINALIGVALVPLTYTLSRQLGMSNGVALGAAIVVASDPSMVNFSAFLGPEVLANVLVLGAVVTLLHALQRPYSLSSYQWAAMSGLLLVLSSYARPVAYMLWIPLGIWSLWMYWKRRWVTAVFAVVSALGIGIWIMHNQYVFHHATFSTVAPYTMAYYRAASVEHIATGDDMEAVYARINQRVVGLAQLDIQADADTRHQFLASSPRVASALMQTSVEIFRAHPLIYLTTFPVGFIRMYGLATYSLACSFGPLAMVEVGWNWLLMIGVFLGMWFAWRDKRWPTLVGILLPILYYTTGTLLVKSAGMTTRERSPLVPWLAVAFVYGLSELRKRFLLQR